MLQKTLTGYTSKTSYTSETGSKTYGEKPILTKQVVEKDAGLFQSRHQDRAAFEKLLVSSKGSEKQNRQEAKMSAETGNATTHCPLPECAQSAAGNTQLDQIIRAIQQIDAEDFLPGHTIETDDSAESREQAVNPASINSIGLHSPATHPRHPINSPEELCNLISKHVDQILIRSESANPGKVETLILALGGTLSGSQLSITKNKAGWKIVCTCPDQLTIDRINQAIPQLNQRMELKKIGPVDFKVKSQFQHARTDGLN
ncbi:MAG: hypothetical protein CSA52_00930 [Gammaproteobacteria bacterium]|nr:MAG: hypothetical protein CSB48_08125 [Pseudomonadota bacterium]PIE38862.1 MAG: hypothetical protein CSA52_00930 [Gammaproteobacteria bacterium]